MKLDNKFRIHFVGSFNEQQLKNQEDKKAIEIAQTKTGLKYITSDFNKKKQVVEVYLGNDFNL